MARQQRSSSALVVLAIGVAGWLLLSHVAPTFVGVVNPAAHGRVRGSTAMKGFAEEFNAWKSTLSADEAKQIAEQAQLAMDKKFSKTDEYTADLPEEKQAALTQLLGKFVEVKDGEVEGKDLEAAPVRPEYDALTKLMGDGSNQKRVFSLENHIVEIDRVAERRYQYALGREDVLKQRDGIEMYPSSPSVEQVKFTLDDKTRPAMKKALEVAAGIKVPEEIDATKFKEELKKLSDAVADPSKTAVVLGQSAAVEELMRMNLQKALNATAEGMKADGTYKGDDTWEKETKLDVTIDLFNDIFTKWSASNAEVGLAADSYKNIYSNIEKETKKTKADVLKEVWAGMKAIGEEFPPLDEDMLTELAKESATPDFISPWGTADKLWKSVAVDRFGAKYLIGIFETQEEAKMAYAEWKKEYDSNFGVREEEYKSKTKIAASEEKTDAAAKDKIRNVLKEARSNMGYTA